jgi:hypothetical protein
VGIDHAATPRRALSPSSCRHSGGFPWAGGHPKWLNEVTASTDKRLLLQKGERSP